MPSKIVDNPSSHRRRISRLPQQVQSCHQSKNNSPTSGRPPTYANGVSQHSLGQSVSECHELSRRPRIGVAAQNGRVERPPSARRLSRPHPSARRHFEPVGPMHRGPPSGLGRRALVLCVIRSAEPLRPHDTQDDAYVRFTHVHLPWAMMLNAFSVTDASRDGEAQNGQASAGGELTYKKTGPFVPTTLRLLVQVRRVRGGV